MKQNAMGKPSMTCNSCHQILGKGPGQSGSIDEKSGEEWLSGSSDRKLELQNKGKI
jgi:hypothetical protein